MTDISYIYTLTCPLTEKLYIGYSNKPKRRAYEHHRDLKNNVHINEYLQRHYNKYLKSLNGKFILNIIDKTFTPEIAILENLWIEELDKDNEIFNLTKGGEDLANLSEEVLKKRHQTIITLKGKFVYCYTIDGKYIGEFRCASEVVNKLNLNLNSVQNAIRRKIKLGKYVFFRELQKDYKGYNPLPNNINKVTVINIKHRTRNVYNSIKECSDKIGINYNTIHSRIMRNTICDNGDIFITKSNKQTWMDKLKTFGTDKIALRWLDEEMGD